MFLRKLPVITLLFTFLLNTVSANDIWRGEAELGIVNTSGNSNTETLNFKSKLVYEREFWRHSGQLESVRVKDSGIITVEHYFASLKSDYKFSEKSYLLALINYEEDHFSGFDYKTSVILGYGRKLLNSDEFKVEVEFGPGRRYSKPQYAERSSENILYAALEAGWKISEYASLEEKLTIEDGPDAVVSRSVTGLKTKVNSKLSAKFSYVVKHTSQVPVGINEYDRESAITLVYSF